MSKQHDLAHKAWTENQEEITAVMLAMAGEYVKSPDEYRMMEILTDDGIFSPFYAASLELSSYDAENGNEDDEALFIGDCWCYVLVHADNPAFLPIVKRLLQIQVFGL